MRYENELRAWLRSERKLSENSTRDVVSRLNRIQRSKGSLDTSFEKDELESLIEEFEFSKSDERLGEKPRHGLSIDGDVYAGTAALKTALRSYQAFRRHRGTGEPDPPPVPDSVDHPRNQILYGPPGTGKTYNTVAHAIAILDGTKTGAVTDEDRLKFPSLKFRTGTSTNGKAEGRVAMITFHQNYAYEDFVEGIRPRLTQDYEPAQGSGANSGELSYELRHGIFRQICEAAENASNQPFVLIIDEINRGNIPKIFGELITLIEPSRRLKKHDATTVTLPYSGHDFGVPDNLYIIGTMNTADRSIQQLDTALRRRFTFVEMMPKEDHKLISTNVKEGFDELGASSNGVNCSEMLRAMNERIALLLDREHQIGHTYLLNVKTAEQLADTFRSRIFPLLQEYFYDDWRKIRAVLRGNAFVKVRKIGEGPAKNLAQKFDLADDEMVIFERLRLDHPAWEDASEYQAIYANANRE